MQCQREATARPWQPRANQGETRFLARIALDETVEMMVRRQTYRLLGGQILDLTGLNEAEQASFLSYTRQDIRIP